jgi:hypothetical protein
MTLTDKLRKWYYTFFEKNSFLIFAIGFFLLVVISPFLLTLPSIYERLDFTRTGQIGDTVGGLTSPIIGFLGAILVYLSFRQQLKANKLQRDALSDEIKRNQQDRRYNSISHDIDVLREEINSFQLFKSELIGTNAIYYFKESFIKTDNKESITSFLNSDLFKNFYFLIATCGNIYHGIVNSNLELEDVISLNRKLIYLYTSKLGVYLLPIIAHCDANAVDNEIVKLLKDTYDRFKIHMDRNKL